MMHRIRLLPSVIWLIVLSALPAAVAGRQFSFPTPGDLVMEMSVGDEGPSDYYVPRTGVLWMEFFEFKRLDNWRKPPDQPAKVGAVHLDYRRLRDAVWIDVMVVFGTIDLSKPLPDDEAHTKSGGTYVIRMGESASLQELARFGIEPFKVKVFPVEVHTLNPAEVENKTKAIEVVRVEQSRERFQVTLKNTSSKNIVVGKVQCRGGAMNFGPLARGQVKEVYLDLESGIRMILRSPQGNPPIRHEPVPPKLAVISVMFEDLTFEGDPELTLTYIARRRGARIQAIRIVGLLQAAIENPEPDSGKALETLSQQLSALPVVPDIQVLNDLAERFGSFTQDQRIGLLSALREGLSDTRYGMLKLTYEKREAPKGTSLQSWLKKVKSDYEEEIKKP